MSLTSGQIADVVNGRLVGREDVKIAGVAPLESAGSGDLSFLASTRHLSEFRSCVAGAVLIAEEYADVEDGPAARIIVTDIRLALTRAVSAIYPDRVAVWGISPRARVGRGAHWNGRVAIGSGATLGRGVKLGRDCIVKRNAVVDDGAVLGDECVVGEHAVVGPGAELGNRVVVRPGARVGGVGFAYAASPDGHMALKHVGRCIVEDDVEVGANTTIDRGSIGDTLVGAGTKIDNLVQIAHNVRIGKRCVIMAQVGLAGSTVIEENVMLAGQAGLAGHLTVGKGARVAAQAGVIGDVDAGSTVSGYPARSHRDVLRQAAALRRLTGLAKSLERLVEADG